MGCVVAAISGGTAESEALPLLTLEVDAQPSIETLGPGLADAKALLARLHARIGAALAAMRVSLLHCPKRTAGSALVFTDGDVQLRQWQKSTLPRARHMLLKWRLWHGRAPEAMRRLATMLYVLGKSAV